MTPFEAELVRLVARFPWRPMSAFRRAKNDFVRRLEGEQRGDAWATRRDITDRERHLLYRMVWERAQHVPCDLIIPVKRWLLEHPKPPTRAEQRKAARAARERTKQAARAAEEPRLL